MKVLVITGSRDWSDRAAIERVLAGADILIVGDCPTGADAIALDVAKNWDIMHIEKEAVNKQYTARNQAIADEALLARDSGFDVHCHAFPLAESRGTWDCLNKLKKHGFPVEVHRG